MKTNTQTSETYMIPEANLAGLNNKVLKANRKAEKLGLAPLTLNIGEPERKSDYDDATQITRVRLTYPVSVTGTYPSIEGWAIIGYIEHTEKANLIDIHTDDDVSEWRKRSPKCDHCGQHRIVKRSYLIKQTDGDKIMGVGATCLKDFLPKSAENMVRMMQWIEDLSGELEDMEHYGSGSWGEDYEPAGIAALAHMCVRKSGWRSSRWADEGVTTAQRVYNGLSRPMFTGRNARELREEWEAYYMEDGINEADRTAAREMAEHYLAKDEDKADNFTILIKQLFEHNRVDHKYVPHLTGAMAGFLKWKEVRREREARDAWKLTLASRNEWVGEPGARMEFDVTLERKYVTDGYYGSTSIYTLRDSEGHTLVWFSSNHAFEDKEPGDKFKLVGTVKEHNEYRDTKQTIITRCKEV